MELLSAVQMTHRQLQLGRRPRKLAETSVTPRFLLFPNGDLYVTPDTGTVVFNETKLIPAAGQLELATTQSKDRTIVFPQLSWLLGQGQYAKLTEQVQDI